MWPASEERLFERFRRRRDPASLARVFDRTAPALLRVAMHLERDPHVAEDLVQQTFLAAIEQADRWDRERGLFPWLVGILSNRARLHRRSRQRAPDPARLPEPPTADPAEHASGRELQGAVGEAVAELGEVYRPVLHLHLFHGLNAKEIGAAIGRPAGTVRTQLVRGLERLRRALPVGLGVAAAISAPALAAMRRRLLERLPTTLNGGGALPATAWTLGGTMTKKWLLLVPAILLGAFAIWRLAVVPVGEVPAPDAPLPSTVATSSTDAASGPDAAPTRDDAERTAANLPVAPIDSLDLGTIEVRCEARLAERAEPVPMAGAWVRLRPSDGLRTTTRIGARTDERGLARLEQVPAGSWTVIAESGHLASRRQVEVEPGGHHQVELVITDGKAVDVLVVDRQRRPVADAEVWVGLRYLGRVWPMECTSRCAAQTDARGRATVVVGAEMRVGARKEGYAESLGVDADAFTGERLVVTLRDQPGHVDGTVYDDAGRPLAGVGLFLGAKEDWSRLGGRDADGSSTAPPVATWTRSDARGRFAFHDVLAGRRNLIAIVPGALDAELDIDVRASETTPVRVTMRRAVRVSGRVLRPDGEPARGVLIYGRDPHGELIAAGSGTDARGTYAMFAPLAGYRIEVRRGGELLREVRSEAPLTGPVERDIVIDEHLLVRGRLLDEQREPLPGWRVVAVADGASADQAVARALAYWQHTTTDARGAFELFGTERGPLLVQCMPEGAFQLDAGHREAGVGVGTTGLDIVVPASKLRRSKLTGRIVGADGGQLTEATVRTYVRRDPPPRCEQGRFVYEGLAHGKAVVIFEAPGHGSRRVVFEVDQAEQDVGDIVLQPAVELRVRPRLADGGEWRGPLPAPAIRTADGRYHEPQPTAFADGGQLVIRTLSPGSYLLVPSRSEQVAAAPLPFTLRVGEPVQLDWPVRVGRRRLLRFQPPADLPAVDGTVLSLRVVHENGAVELEHQQEVHRGAWFVRHTFVPGRYRVTATTPAGHRFEGGFEVILQKDEAEVATEVVVPPRR